MWCGEDDPRCVARPLLIWLGEECERGVLCREQLGVRTGELCGAYGGGGVRGKCAPAVLNAVGLLRKLSTTLLRPDTLTVEV